MPARKNVVTARSTAALPAAGAWDSTPTTIDVGQYDWAAVYMTYQANAAAVSNTGYADVKIEKTIDHSTWHPECIVDNESSATAVANGLDEWQGKLHSHILYHDTPGTTTGTQSIPIFRVGLYDAAAMRVVCREAGELGKPGTVGVKVVLVAEE